MKYSHDMKILVKVPRVGLRLDEVFCIYLERLMRKIYQRS